MSKLYGGETSINFQAWARFWLQKLTLKLNNTIECCRRKPKMILFERSQIETIRQLLKLELVSSQREFRIVSTFLLFSCCSSSSSKPLLLSLSSGCWWLSESKNKAKVSWIKYFSSSSTNSTTFNANCTVSDPVDTLLATEASPTAIPLANRASSREFAILWVKSRHFSKLVVSSQQQTLWEGSQFVWGKISLPFHLVKLAFESQPFCRPACLLRAQKA